MSSRIEQSFYNVLNINLNESLVSDFKSVKAIGSYIASKLINDRYSIEEDYDGIVIDFEINGKEGSFIIELNSDGSAYVSVFYDTTSKNMFRMVFYRDHYEMHRESTLYYSAPTSKNITTKSELDNIITYLNRFIRSKAEKVSDSYLAKKFGMTDKNTDYYGLRGMFARYTMAFGDSFKYSDDCEYDKQITSILKKVFKKSHLPAINNSNKEATVNKVWRLNINPKILLVSTTGYHFLTTENDLYEDVKKLIEIYKNKGY